MVPGDVSEPMSATGPSRCNWRQWDEGGNVLLSGMYKHGDCTPYDNTLWNENIGM